jgi:hypothetical protein
LPSQGLNPFRAVKSHARSSPSQPLQLAIQLSILLETNWSLFGWIDGGGWETLVQGKTNSEQLSKKAHKGYYENNDY